MPDDNKFQLFKSDDERLHDLALIYLQVRPDKTPEEFAREYYSTKEQMRLSQKEFIRTMRDKRIKG